MDPPWPLPATRPRFVRRSRIPKVVGFGAPCTARWTLVQRCWQPVPRQECHQVSSCRRPARGTFSGWSWHVGSGPETLQGPARGRIAVHIAARGRLIVPNGVASGPRVRQKVLVAPPHPRPRTRASLISQLTSVQLRPRAPPASPLPAPPRCAAEHCKRHAPACLAAAAPSPAPAPRTAAPIAPRGCPAAARHGRRNPGNRRVRGSLSRTEAHSAGPQAGIPGRPGGRAADQVLGSLRPECATQRQRISVHLVLQRLHRPRGPRRRGILQPPQVAFPRGPRLLLPLRPRRLDRPLLLLLPHRPLGPSRHHPPERQHPPAPPRRRPPLHPHRARRLGLRRGHPCVRDARGAGVRAVRIPDGLVDVGPQLLLAELARLVRLLLVIRRPGLQGRRLHGVAVLDVGCSLMSHRRGSIGRRDGMHGAFEDRWMEVPAARNAS